MSALGDIRLVRGLLDQAEMGAVRAARLEGRSWAEIATMLGVTRQSAWERWHDLVDSAGGERPPVPLEPAEVEALLSGITAELKRDSKLPILSRSVLAARSRVEGGQGILAVRFDAEAKDEDLSYLGFWGVERDATDWRLAGGMAVARLGERGPTTATWFRSGGWSTDGGWCFGGVLADPAVCRVVVATGGGATIEDNPMDGVVLIIADDGDLSSATIELFDAVGQRVGTGKLLEPRQ